MSGYTVPVMVVCIKRKGPYTLSLLWAVTNMSQGDTRIFAAPDPAVVGIDFTTDMKRVLVTENYVAQKSLIVLHPKKHLPTEFLMNLLICIHKVLNDG
jgi:hypothetical protein